MMLTWCTIAVNLIPMSWQPASFALELLHAVNRDFNNFATFLYNIT